MADIDASISAFISQLPKVELHVHIEGTLTPSLRWRLAQKNHISLPKYPTYESLIASYATMYNHRREMQGDNGLPTFLEAYYGGMEVLRTEEDFYDLAMEYFAKAADMNVRYTDPFFDPQAHTRRGVALRDVMNGLERAKQDAKTRYGVEADWTMCFLRDMDPSSAMETYKQALEGGFGRVFHAVGLDSNEYDRPPSLFRDVFARARMDGYWVTAHCDVGQKNTHEHIHEIAVSCVGGVEGADRIDHGLNAVERPELIQIIKQRGLGLTLCPHAYHRRLPTEYVFGSIKKLWDEGVRITIASDDPTYMHQRWVQENLELVMHYCGFNSRDMIRLQKNGVDISWAAGSEPGEQNLVQIHPSLLAGIEDIRGDGLNMTILLTGGTGKTATRIARLLQDANQPILRTSRKGVVPEPFKGVKFDWYDPSTFENVFTADPNIDRIYLVAPAGSSEVFPPMKPFIDLAVQKGVKRFVLLSASGLEPGQPAMGKVHEYLLSLEVDYAVIRPSWFFENFLTLHLSTIKEQNTILSASADGKIGFISADDIADLAVSTLTDEKSHNTDYILTGPELLSYDDVAAIFSEVLGRKITHTRITVEELKKRYLAFGLPEDYAEMLSSLDDLNAKGVEERLFVAPKKVAGKRTLRSFVEANKDLF